MRRAGTDTEHQAILPLLGVLLLILAGASGCSPAPGGTGGGTSAGTAPAAPSRAPSGSAPTAPAPRPATSEAAARVWAALEPLGSGGARPQTEQIQAVLAGAGFPAGSIEVTASRTPTGLDADAVEASVRQGRDCVVAQLRNGAVAVTVLPVLADGRCLAGSRG